MDFGGKDSGPAVNEGIELGWGEAGMMVEEGEENGVVMDEGMELGWGEANATVEEVEDGVGTLNAPFRKSSSSSLLDVGTPSTPISTHWSSSPTARIRLGSSLVF